MEKTILMKFERDGHGKALDIGLIERSSRAVINTTMMEKVQEVYGMSVHVFVGCAIKGWITDTPMSQREVMKILEDLSGKKIREATFNASILPRLRKKTKLKLLQPSRAKEKYEKKPHPKSQYSIYYETTCVECNKVYMNGPEFPYYCACPECYPNGPGYGGLREPKKTYQRATVGRS